MLPVPKRISLVKLFFSGLIAITLLISGIHWGEWYYVRNRNFNHEISLLRKNYIEQQKEILNREVESAIEFARFQRLQYEEEARLDLKEKIAEAYNLASNLYAYYHGYKPDAEIFDIIKESLRNIRFDKNRYFFIVDSQTRVELLPYQPAEEGKLLTRVGNHISHGFIRAFSQLIDQQEEGFLSYQWYKPGENRQVYEKTTYVKHFKAADWYIGTGFYRSDFEEKSKQTVLKRISDIRFGRDGFLFAMDYSGRMIAHPEPKLIGNIMPQSKHASIRQAFPHMLEDTKDHGAFVEYSYSRPGRDKLSRKISYVARLPEWQWLVGAGFFLDDFDAVIAEKRQRLHKELTTDTWRMIALSLFAIFCSALIARFVAIKLRRNSALFNQFFIKASSESVKIEPGDILFSEFEQLAVAANRMIDARCQSEAERKQLEMQLLQHQKLEALGTLAGGIAHDFNNLLAGICGNMTLLKMKLDPDSPLHKYLGRMSDSTDNAKKLIAQILCFSRFSKEEKTGLDLGAEISSTLELLRASIPASVHIESELPHQVCPVLINKTQLQQVLMNLCSNALQALPKQAGTIRLTLTLEEGQGVATQNSPSTAVAHLEICDDGVGIEQDLIDKIFDPFFTTKDINKGTGLGLSIVHRIITDHKGWIEVDSRPGYGTSFHIYLPLASVKQLVAAETMAEPLEGQGRILLVDDDEKVLLSTKELLEQLGYQVTAMAGAQTAYDYLLIHHQDLDILISDQTMPGMTGLELVEKVRLFNDRLPVILCSGYSAQINEASLAQAGIVYLVMKPVDIVQLSHILKDAMAANTITPSSENN